MGQRLDVASVSLWLIDELEAPARGGLPTVPGYELERELGRGEFGTVYLAVQQSLQHKVALKVLSRSQAARERCRAPVPAKRAPRRASPMRTW
ncbi:MAG: hypothetical protein R3E96_08025 [Planctomycetota bacterium]